MDKLTSSVLRTNARFRGPTELNQYINLVNETVHDMKILGTILDRDDFIFSYERGQTDFIEDNMLLYFSGFSGFMSSITSSIDTAGTLVKQGNPFIENVDLLAPEWLLYGECLRGGTSQKTTLASPNTTTPSGISHAIEVQEGQNIMIRMAVRNITGESNDITIGSQDINNGAGSTKKFVVKNSYGPTYISHVIEPKHKGNITLSLEVKNSVSGIGKVEIEELSVTLLEKEKVSLQPLNRTMKSRVNALSSEIKNIINNL